MEFILNNKMYSIQNNELFINYLMVDNYFRHGYSKYSYDITFDFVEPILDEEKVEFEDILECTQVLEEMIEKAEINFTPSGLRIDELEGSNFRITYQNLIFDEIHVGEAIPLLIALTSLLNYKPTVSLSQIAEELENFINMFRAYNENAG